MRLLGIYGRPFRRINDTGYRDITEKGRARTKMAESYLPDRQR